MPAPQRQAFADRVTPYTYRRWAATGVLLLLFLARIFWLHGWYIVTYALGIYVLNLFIHFLTPKSDPESGALRCARFAVLVLTCCPTADGPVLPQVGDDEFRPFERKLPEYRFWFSVTRAVVLAFGATLFR